MCAKIKKIFYQPVKKGPTVPTNKKTCNFLSINKSGQESKSNHQLLLPTFDGNTGDNGKCGTLLSQQDIGVWLYCVHAGLRKGEHGEESGGHEPDGWGVLMNNQIGFIEMASLYSTITKWPPNHRP